MSLNIAKSTPTTLMCGQSFEAGGSDDRGSSVCGRPTKRGKKKRTGSLGSKKPKYTKTEYSPSLLMGGGINKKNIFVEGQPSESKDDGSFTPHPSFSALATVPLATSREASRTKKAATPETKKFGRQIMLGTFLDAELQARNDSRNNTNDDDDDDESTIPDDNSLMSLPPETEEVLTKLVEERNKNLFGMEKALELPKLSTKDDQQDEVAPVTHDAHESEATKLDDEVSHSSPFPTSALPLLSPAGDQREETSPWRFYSGAGLVSPSSEKDHPKEDCQHIAHQEETSEAKNPQTPQRTRSPDRPASSVTPLSAAGEQEEGTSPWRFYSGASLATPSSASSSESVLAENDILHGNYTATASNPQSPPLRKTFASAKPPVLTKSPVSVISSWRLYSAGLITNEANRDVKPKPSNTKEAVPLGPTAAPWRFYSAGLPSGKPSRPVAKPQSDSSSLDTSSAIASELATAPWRFYSAGLSTSKPNKPIPKPLSGPVSSTTASLTAPSLPSRELATPATAAWRFYSARFPTSEPNTPISKPSPDLASSTTSSSTSSSLVSRGIDIVPPMNDMHTKEIEGVSDFSCVPLVRSLCCLAICTIAGGYLAAFELRSAFAIDLFTGIAIMLMALSSSLRAPISSFAVWLYGAKTVASVCLLAPEDTNSFVRLITETIDSTSSSQDGRSGIEDNIGKSLEGLVLCEAANLFYILLALTPHLWRGCTPRYNNETLLQSISSFLGIMISLWGFSVQALGLFDPLVMEGLLGKTNMVVLDGDTVNVMLAFVSESVAFVFEKFPFLSSTTDLIDIGELGIWLGIWLMNLLAGRQTSVPRIIMTTGALIALVVTTYHVRFVSEASSLLPMDQEWFVTLQTATNATFTRYNAEIYNSSNCSCLDRSFLDGQSLESNLMPRTWEGALISILRNMRSD